MRNAILVSILLATNAHALTPAELSELSNCQMVNNANPSERCIYLQVQKLQENHVPEPKPGDANYFGLPPGWESEMTINNTINGLLEQTQKLEPRLKKIERRLKKLERR